MKRKIIILVIFSLLLAVLLILLFTVFLFQKPDLVKESNQPDLVKESNQPDLVKESNPILGCKDKECLKNFVITKDFNPEQCKDVLQNLQNDCYYFYEVENKEIEKGNPGRHCGLITDEERRADCFYKTRGAVVLTSDIKKKLSEAISSSDNSQCDEFSIPEFKNECINGIELIKTALIKKDALLCSGEYVFYFIKQICFEKLRLQNNE